MYTPLQFMEQVENMVRVNGYPHLDTIANERCLRFYDEVIDFNRAEALIRWAWSWNTFRHKKATKEDKKMVRDLSTEFSSYTGLASGNSVDLLHQSLMYILHHDWSRSKRVYKMEDNMRVDLCSMTPPKVIPYDVIAKLPSKCFYIDLGEIGTFVQDSRGFFVMWDIVDELCIIYMTSLIEHKKLIPMNSMVMFTVKEGESIDTHFDRYGKERTLTVEDDTSIRVFEQAQIKFFYNFCLYLSAANNDVQYTERTRQLYKPSTDTKPKNRMREVEEFGVGYKYSTNIQQGKVRVKYVGESQEKDENAPKRSYSSNYRSAHWHHYWVNDPDNVGSKKLIVKWIPEIFVRGNTEDTRVVVHKVKKGK